MRSSTGIEQNLRRLIESQLQKRIRCEVQVGDTIVAPDINTFENGEVRIIEAGTEAKIYLRAGSKLYFSAALTEVT